MNAHLIAIPKARYLAVLFAWLAATIGGAVFADPGEEKEALAREVAALFRAARKVLSDNQDLINDPAKGDKGLTPERIVELA